MSNFLDKAGLQHYTEKVKAMVITKAGGFVQAHEVRSDNPHHVNKSQVGLSKVTNEAQIPLSQKGVASGVATLGTDGKLTAAQLPAMKTVNGVSVVGSGNISIDLSLYKVVDTLPITNIDATKIYIVPAEKTDDNNIKVEYIYTGDPASAYDASKWEKLGDAQTNIVVDAELSPTSTNPVQNKAVTENFNRMGTLYVLKYIYEQNFSSIQDRIGNLETENTNQDTAIAACVKTADLVAITTEEIDAMF